MQTELFLQQEDFSDEDILLGLSGGINSAAVLCWLSTWEEHLKPKVLHLYYAHFEEHSPDTFPFVKDLIEYAKNHFKDVRVMITRNSVLRFFESQNYIPHPQVAPCTRLLKVIPMHAYMAEHGITTDLVGYVRDEVRRVKNMAKKTDSGVEGRTVQIKNVRKLFPISDKSNEWCFKIVKKEIGWYPALYELKNNDKGYIKYCLDNLHRFPLDVQKTIKNKLGKRTRVFSHNNCLPCKNMQFDDYLAVEYFFSDYYKKSIELSERLSKHWGRTFKDFEKTKNVDQLIFNLSFGRTEEETGYKKQSCGVCSFD